MPTRNTNEGTIFCPFDIAFVKLELTLPMELQDRNCFGTVDGQAGINQQVQKSSNLGNGSMKIRC